MPLDNILNAPIQYDYNPYTNMQTAVIPWLRPYMPQHRDEQQEEMRHGLRLLQEARHRIAMPGVWCKGHDELPNPEGMGGMAFCSRGIVRYLSVRLGLIAKQAFIALAAEVPPGSRLEGGPEATIANYNDFALTTLTDVLNMFDRAIACLESQVVPQQMAVA